MPNPDATLYRTHLAYIGITMRELARLLGVHDTVARRWGMTDRSERPPREVMAWLDKCVADPDPESAVRSTLPEDWHARSEPVGMYD
jgi:hypothetical protein